MQRSALTWISDSEEMKAIYENFNAVSKRLPNDDVGNMMGDLNTKIDSDDKGTYGGNTVLRIVIKIVKAFQLSVIFTA